MVWICIFIHLCLFGQCMKNFTLKLITVWECFLMSSGIWNSCKSFTTVVSLIISSWMWAMAVKHPHRATWSRRVSVKRMERKRMKPLCASNSFNEVKINANFCLSESGWKETVTAHIGQAAILNNKQAIAQFSASDTPTTVRHNTTTSLKQHFLYWKVGSHCVTVADPFGGENTSYQHWNNDTHSHWKLEVSYLTN